RPFRGQGGGDEVAVGRPRCLRLRRRRGRPGRGRRSGAVGRRPGGGPGRRAVRSRLAHLADPHRHGRHGGGRRLPLTAAAAQARRRRQEQQRQAQDGGAEDDDAVDVDVEEGEPPTGGTGTVVTVVTGDGRVVVVVEADGCVVVVLSPVGAVDVVVEAVGEPVGLVLSAGGGATGWAVSDGSTGRSVAVPRPPSTSSTQVRPGSSRANLPSRPRNSVTASLSRFTQWTGVR